MAQQTQRTAARNLDIYRRFIAGEVWLDLAKEHDLNPRTVARICKSVEKDIMADAVVEVTAIKKLETAELKILLREALHGWQHSKHPRERRRVRTVTKGNAGKDEAGKAAEVVVTATELAKEDRDGNPRFLEVAVKIHSDIRRIWGADAVVEWDAPDLQARAILTTLEHQAAIADEQARNEAADDFERLCPPRNRIAGHVRGNGQSGLN